MRHLSFLCDELGTLVLPNGFCVLFVVLHLSISQQPQFPFGHYTGCWMQLAKTTPPSPDSTPTMIRRSTPPQGPKVANPPRLRRVRKHLALEACKRGGGVLLLHLYEMIILVDILYLMTKLGLCYSSCLRCQRYYSINFELFYVTAEL